MSALPSVRRFTFVTKDNEDTVDNILKEFNSGAYSIALLNEAVNNYNNSHSTNLTLKEFASTISNYASSEDKKGNLIADETIAEAVHDYYLHGNDMKETSKEIISVINSKL